MIVYRKKHKVKIFSLVDTFFSLQIDDTVNADDERLPSFLFHSFFFSSFSSSFCFLLSRSLLALVRSITINYFCQSNKPVQHHR